ncbi:MAG: transcriptional repressor [Candidatus Komeilibacteria bacterium]
MNKNIPPHKRLTLTRKLLLEFLKEHKGHFTADEVLQRINSENKVKMGRASVYRNLQLLSKWGLIYQLAYPGEPLYYEWTKQEHGHFHCNHCKRLFNIESFPPAQAMVEGHYVQEAHWQLSGICHYCLQENFN